MISNKILYLIIFILLLILVYLGIKELLKGDFLFSNMGYSGKIEIETFLVSSEQLPKVIDNSKDNLNLETFQQLYDKNVYLVVKVKNMGSASAWGLLKCNITRGVRVIVYINHVPFKKWDTYMIPLGIFPESRTDPVGIPNPAIEWQKLYTK